MRSFPVGLLLVGVLTGCGGPRTLYYWGHYEGLLYAMFTHPGEADPVMQIQILNQDIEQAHASGQPVPPGVHAHLGYLLYRQGNLEAARREFETEKALFPESSTLMDHMLKRMQE